MAESSAVLSGQEAKRSKTAMDSSSSRREAQMQSAKPEADFGPLQEVLQKIGQNGGQLSRGTVSAELLGLAEKDRARTFQAMQKAYGNRYVQMLISSARQSERSQQGIDSNKSGTPVSSNGSSHASSSIHSNFHSNIPSNVSSNASSNASSIDIRAELGRSSGRSLEPDVRSSMESRFGQDLGSVSLHTDVQAARLALDLKSQAFTVGQDVFFGSGKYQPKTMQGRALLAHELVHTRQNAAPQALRKGPLDNVYAVSSNGDSLEREAQHAAGRVAAGLHVGRLAFSGAQGTKALVSRQASDATAAKVDIEAVALEIIDHLLADPGDRKGITRQMMAFLDPASRIAVMGRVQSRVPPQRFRQFSQSLLPDVAVKLKSPSKEKATEAKPPLASTAAESSSSSPSSTTTAGSAAIKAASSGVVVVRTEPARALDAREANAPPGKAMELQPEKQEEKTGPRKEPVAEGGARPAEGGESGTETPAMAKEEPTKGERPAAATKPEAEGEKVPAGEGAAVEEATPEGVASPEGNPDFQKVVERTKKAAAAASSHAPAKAKSAEAQAAATGPANEVSSKAAAGQVEAMSQAQPKPFDKAAFKAALMQKIASITPKNLEEAEKFKESGKAESLKGDLTSQVSRSKEQSQGDVKEKVEEEPDKSGIEPKPVTPIPPEKASKAPGGVNAAEAAPKQVSDSVVSLQQGSEELDSKLSDAGVTDEQLEKSNEPDFQSALQSKKSAQEDAKNRPQEFRKAEQAVIVQARSEMVAAEKSETTAMQLSRGQQMAGVAGLQVNAKGSDEKERARVSDHIQQIYDQTKSKVEARLKKLDDDVNSAFDKGSAEATSAFEEYVARRMKEYKDERYSGLEGPILWAKDKLFDMPEEVNRFYEEGKALYSSKMDGVIDGIAALVEAGLNESREEIASGKKEVQEYVDSQPEALKSVAEEAAQGIQGKFDELESRINEKQNQLIDTMANKYVESSQQIDARIQEMKAENRGLVSSALDAVKGVIETILNLKNMLLSTLARAASAIDLIIKDPIKFLGNLVAGVKQGLQNFMSKIGHYLLEGLMGWLFGALAEAGIQLPESFDLKGILSLVLQVLGLTYANIRSRAVKIVGEKVVSAMEKTAGIIYDVITKGPGVLWDWIKDKLGDLKSMILGPIKSFVQEKIIIAGVTWLLGLLNPAGAFIKAVKAIYDIVMFFVERGSQIMALVNAIIDSIVSIATGNISVAANMVEKALAKAIPVAIGFLAALLGLGGISEKIKSVIEAIRAPISKAIDWVVGKAVELIKKAGKFLGFGKKEEKEEEKDKGPDDRTPRQKQDDLDKAIIDGENLMDEENASPDRIRAGLPAIKSMYRLTSLSLIGEENGKYHIDAAVNPNKSSKHKHYKDKCCAICRCAQCPKEFGGGRIHTIWMGAYNLKSANADAQNLCNHSEEFKRICDPVKCPRHHTQGRCGESETEERCIERRQ